jgi:hypothetical protein
LIDRDFPTEIKQCARWASRNQNHVWRYFLEMGAFANLKFKSKKLKNDNSIEANI